MRIKIYIINSILILFLLLLMYRGYVWYTAPNLIKIYPELIDTILLKKEFLAILEAAHGYPEGLPEANSQVQYRWLRLCVNEQFQNLKDVIFINHNGRDINSYKTNLTILGQTQNWLLMMAEKAPSPITRKYLLSIYDDIDLYLWKCFQNVP